MAEWEQACAANEIEITIATPYELAELLAILEYDQTRAGAMGRALTQDLPRRGLKRFDRLEPCLLHLDIASIDDRRSDFPITLRFWRNRNSMVKHRNPLFSEQTLLSPDTLCVDEMHTMHLGVFAHFVAHALWRVVVADVWQLRQDRSAEAGNVANFGVIKERLWKWYKASKVLERDGGTPVYELTHFDMLSIGGSAAPALSGPKAAETGSLLRFTTGLLRELDCSLLQNGPALLECGECLTKYLDVTRAAGPRLRSHEVQKLFDASLRFLALREAAGIPWIPKMHLMVHLIFQTPRFGNPLHCATWADESNNLQFARVCAAANPIVFERRVLATFS